VRFLDGKTCFSIKDHGQNIFTCPCISIKGSEVLINKTLKKLSKMLFTALYSSTQLQYRLTQCNFFSSTHVFFFVILRLFYSILVLIVCFDDFVVGFCGIKKHAIIGLAHDYLKNRLNFSFFKRLKMRKKMQTILSL
jgi:hypothetical protein